MKQSLKQYGRISALLLGVIGLTAVPLASASALSQLKTSTTAAATSDSSTNTTAADQAKLKVIITHGDTEITRRLKTLNTLSSKISSDSKLSASSKTALSNEVSTEISGLTNLKSQLDAETTLAAGKADAQSIFSDYRVYALIVPKVLLVKVADDQQVTESKLTTLAGKVQTQINTDKAAGKDVSSEQTKLNDMNNEIAAASAISTSVESKVINLQPSDYNTDHTILSGDRDQLKNAQTDLTTALGDAKTTIASLKNL